MTYSRISVSRNQSQTELLMNPMIHSKMQRRTFLHGATAFALGAATFRTRAAEPSSSTFLINLPHLLRAGGLALWT